MEKFLVNYGISGGVAGDIFFFLILIAIGIGLGFLIGRYRLVALLSSVYIASAVFATFPSSYLPKDPIYALVIFTGLVLVFTFLDEYLFDVNAEIAEKMWKSVVVGFFAVGVFVSVAVSMVPWSVASDILSKQTYGYFADPWARFFWMVAPLVFFFLVKKRWGRR
jgi:hypothetical protein